MGNENIYSLQTSPMHILILKNAFNKINMNLYVVCAIPYENPATERFQLIICTLKT